VLKTKTKMSSFYETTIFIHSLSKDILFRYGKNAQGNFTIIDMSNPDDIWFHVANESSVHVIACIPEEKKVDKKQKQQIIKQGAVLCKNISKHKSTKNLEITYCKIGDLEKTDTPGSVIVKNGKTITI
jgi:predicted ribosome quality control (RQC) complex YloA/Tae2 family protein